MSIHGTSVSLHHEWCPMHRACSREPSGGWNGQGRICRTSMLRRLARAGNCKWPAVSHWHVARLPEQAVPPPWQGSMNTTHSGHGKAADRQACRQRWRRRQERRRQQCLALQLLCVLRLHAW